MTNTKCPCCWQPAYVGFLHIECATKDCRNFSSKMLDPAQKTSNPTKFKVGDRVRITALKDSGATNGSWFNKDMEKYVGGNGTIFYLGDLGPGDEFAKLKDCTREGMEHYSWWLCSLETLFSREE